MNGITSPRARVWAALISALLFSFSAVGAEIDVYVMSGQSNMLGHSGDASQYPPDRDKLDRKVLFYAHGWTFMQPQIGQFPRGHFGPEVTFSRELARLGGNVAIFKYSQGSTSIANDWLAPGAGGMYDQMLSALSDAMSGLRAAGHQPVIRALVWIQGESDAQTAEMADAYHGRLSLMLSHFRGFVGNDSLPVILGVDEQHPWVRINPQIVAAHQAIAQGDGITFTSMIGLEKADSSHLTPRALVTHGKRLFTALTGLQASPDDEYLILDREAAKRDARLARKEKRKAKRKRSRLKAAQNNRRRR